MNNIERLGNLFTSQIKRTVDGNKSIIAELGTIGANLSLKVSSVKNAIPKGQYMLSRSLTLGSSGSKLTVTKSGQGKHEHTDIEESGEHNHDVVIPDKMRSIRSGDRVLVIWVGSEAVVVDIVKSS